MALVATLEQKVIHLEERTKRIEGHDEAQDKAIYKLEGDVRDVKKDIALILKGQEKTHGILKGILAISGCSAIDAVGWNLWDHVEPYLQPYMSREFFWFSISTVGLILFVYGVWVVIHSNRKGTENGNQP